MSAERPPWRAVRSLSICMAWSNPERQNHCEVSAGRTCSFSSTSEHKRERAHLSNQKS